MLSAGFYDCYYYLLVVYILNIFLFMLGWAHSEMALDLRECNAWPVPFWLKDSRG